MRIERRVDDAAQQIRLTVRQIIPEWGTWSGCFVSRLTFDDMRDGETVTVRTQSWSSGERAPAIDNTAETVLDMDQVDALIGRLQQIQASQAHLRQEKANFERRQGPEPE